MGVYLKRLVGIIRPACLIDCYCLFVGYICQAVQFKITGCVIVPSVLPACSVPEVDKHSWRPDPFCVGLFDGCLFRFGDLTVVADVITGRQRFLVGERMKISGVIFRKVFTPRPITYTSVNEAVI